MYIYVEVMSHYDIYYAWRIFYMTNKESIYTENKIKFYVFQDERFVDLNLYQFG